MPHSRYYTSADLIVNASVELEEEDARHLSKVMRAAVGDTVELINGRGVLAIAKVSSVTKSECTLHVKSVQHEDAPKTKIVLLQALPKINRLDTILEKATELGVDEILLFPGERSEKQDLSQQQTVRANAILIAASKQSGRLYLPKISVLGPISQWPKFSGTLFFGDVSPQAKPLWDTLEKGEKGDVYFCVGPEAGLSHSEEKQLKGKGFEGVTLHRNILRTDTAPIAALAIISHFKLR